MRNPVLIRVLITSTLAIGSQAATGATITGWNTENVEVPSANPPDDTTGESVIYDRDPSDPAAVTNGKIVYTPPEGLLPGIEVENRLYTFGPASVNAQGCIRASAPTLCDGPRQSGKRFKQVATGFGATDLIFDVDPDGAPAEGSDADVGYRVFHRLINGTNRRARGFSVTLGFGLGDSFTASTPEDGLGFSTGISFGDDGVSSFSQFPFGLFGDADDNPNFDLSGFFDDTSRSGFSVSQSEDLLKSTGFYGAYDDLFGLWLPQSDVPPGALWDNDGDDSTDALVMAWFNEELGQWEIRRAVDPDDPTKAITLDTPIFVDDFDDVETTLGIDLDRDAIEDLANLNVNFGIALDDSFSGSEFTMRVAVQPVPLPAGLPLLGAGAALFGYLGHARRRRAAA